MNPETMRFEPVTESTPSDWAQFTEGELIPLKGWWWKVERCGENLLILSVVKPTGGRKPGLRARASAKGVVLATPPDSQREIDIRTGKRMGPDEGGVE